MADGAKSGKLFRVMIGTYFVVNIENYSLSGFVNEIITHGSLEKAVIGKDYGIGDSGSVELVGNYDPSDTTGQGIIESAGLNQSKLTDMYFALDVSGTSKFVPDVTADSSACALVSKCRAVDASMSAVAKIAFTVELGGMWATI